MSTVDKKLSLRSKHDDPFVKYRPEFRVWNDGGEVWMTMGPEYGACQRQATMSPAAARYLGKYFLEAADAAIEETIVSMRANGRLNAMGRSEAEERAIRENESIQRRQGKLPRQLED